MGTKRKCITRWVIELVTSPLSVAQVTRQLANLDDRIQNPDQMMTVDIQRFSNHLAAIYANLAKPILDVILYNYQLSQSVGAEGLVLLTALIQGSAALRKHYVASSMMCSKYALQFELSRRLSACTQRKRLPCPERCGILIQD